MAGAVVLLGRVRRTGWAFLERLPDAEALDAQTVRFVGFGFIFWTISMAAGAVWADQSWGRYWGWDPIETWSLVAWLAYGSLLHARIFYRLRGAAVAWATLGCFGVVVLTAFLLPLLMPSIHAAYFQ